ncbi:MAG: DNA ligase, partial [Steroidobacteraceae bacterium]
GGPGCGAWGLSRGGGGGAAVPGPPASRDQSFLSTFALATSSSA